MKKVIDVSIGAVKFSLEEDAYSILQTYLKQFRATIANETEAQEVMEDVELRVAEILTCEQNFANRVINTHDVQKVINLLGKVDQEPPSGRFADNHTQHTTQSNEQGYIWGDKRIYRNPNDAMLAGICGGLAVYLGVDSTLVRLIFVLVVLVFGSGILIYIVMWIVMQRATTITQQLEMRGYAPNAENIKRYSTQGF